MSVIGHFGAPAPAVRQRGDWTSLVLDWERSHVRVDQLRVGTGAGRNGLDTLAIPFAPNPHGMQCEGLAPATTVFQRCTDFLEVLLESSRDGDFRELWDRSLPISQNLTRGKVFWVTAARRGGIEGDGPRGVVYAA